MAPLSVLPGRLRFEAASLIGNKAASFLVGDMMLSRKGVKEATASHRTGRVLVLFDEGVVSRSEVEGRLASALQVVERLKEAGASVPPLRRPGASREASSHRVGQFVMEMALHAFLPAPLDLLLPTAAAFRR